MFPLPGFFSTDVKTFIRWFDEMFGEGFRGFVAVMSFFETALAASCHLTESTVSE